MIRLLRWWLIRRVWMFTFREAMKQGTGAPYATAQAEHAVETYGAKFHGLVISEDRS